MTAKLFVQALTKFSLGVVLIGLLIFAGLFLFAYVLYAEVLREFIW